MSSVAAGAMEAGARLLVPVDRGRAAMRGLMWCSASVPLMLLVRAIVLRIHFQYTGVHSRLVDVSLALIALPVAVAALGCVVRGVRHLLLAVWWNRLGVFADDNFLALYLGPFGTCVYPVGELDIKYLFELSGDEESFEAFLPEEVQRSTMLPRMLHPAAKEEIQRTILCHATGTEKQVAMRMRPWIERVTHTKNGPQ